MNKILDALEDGLAEVMDNAQFKKFVQVTLFQILKYQLHLRTLLRMTLEEKMVNIKNKIL